MPRTSITYASYVFNIYLSNWCQYKIINNTLDAYTNDRFLYKVPSLAVFSIYNRLLSITRRPLEQNRFRLLKQNFYVQHFKKRDTKLMVVTLLILHQFSFFFTLRFSSKFAAKYLLTILQHMFLTTLPHLK